MLKASDLDIMLNTILGFLPNLYLQQPILETTTGRSSVMSIIREYYQVETSASSRIDFANL